MTNKNPWIVSRALERTEGDFEVKIGQPEQVDDYEWRCPYSVADETQYAYGVDGFQALVMAIAGVRFALDKLEAPVKMRGADAGDHGVPRMVPQALGVEFSRKIEALIDSEVNQSLADAERVARAKGLL